MKFVTSRDALLRVLGVAQEVITNKSAISIMSNVLLQTDKENQKVIDTGLYGIVRHPMYSATLLMFLSIPLILGSVISFAIMLAYIPIIAVRMNNEEKVLEEGLEGYKEYKQKVKYKVIPFIW